jgi:Family of unknown function (DUF6335)
MPDPRLNSLTGADSEDDAENEAYRTEVNGDEAVGGSTAVPSQNDTEELAEAVGIVIDDDTPLDTEEMLLKRDRDRWEFDPASVVDEPIEPGSPHQN